MAGPGAEGSAGPEAALDRAAALVVREGPADLAALADPADVVAVQEFRMVAYWVR